MYPLTIEGLFDCVVTGSRADLEQFLTENKKENQFNINQLDINNSHIINYIFRERVKDFEEKIAVLIFHGAILKYDPHCNILLVMGNLTSLEIQQKMIKLISDDESFNGVYTAHHFNAVIGIKPKNKQKAFKTDLFGLYPIHYAIAFGTLNETWFENVQYEFIDTIENGIYKGANLFWHFYSAKNLYPHLTSLQIGLPSEKRYQILISALSMFIRI